MNDRDLTPAESAVLLLDEAESLIWALLDGQLDGAEVEGDQLKSVETSRLTQLINENEEVRRRYLECVQLHVDLQTHFAIEGAARPRTPILPNLLAGGIPGTEVHITD